MAKALKAAQLIIEGEGGGLRERQKARRRTAILAAGKALFLKQGYAATSMDEIADDAEVGIATVYNYFGSKGQLLADILQPEFDLMFEQGKQLLCQLPEDAVVGGLQLIDIYCVFHRDWNQKDVLRSVIGPGLSAEPVLDTLCFEAETRVKKQLEELIICYQKRNLIRTEIDVSDAATIIFYIFNQHFIEYVTHVEDDFDRMKRKMDRQISFILTAIQTA